MQNNEEDGDVKWNRKGKDARDKSKQQAREKVDDFKHQVEKAKHEVAKVVPQPVKNAADNISDKAHEAKV